MKAEDEFSIIDFLIQLAHRKQVVLVFAAVFAVISLIVSVLIPQRFTATVTILPPQQNTSLGSAFASQLGTLANLGGITGLAGGALGLKNPNDMYVAMLRSRTVEDEMVRRFELQQEYHKKLVSDAAKAFEDHTEVNGSGKDGLIRISVNDRDPKRAAELANGYLDQFRKFSGTLAVTEASQRRIFFEQQLLQAKDKLADAEESMKVTEQKTGVIQLDSQARALIESAAAIRAQIAAKEVQIRSLETYATGENAQIVQAREELQGLRAQLSKLGGSENQNDDSMIVPKGKVPEAGLEYVRKLRDVKYYETIFEILARQFEIAKLDEAKEGSLIQVVDSAVPPDKRSFPHRLWIVVGGTLFGCVVGALFVFVKTNSEITPKLLELLQALGIRKKSVNAVREVPTHASVAK